MPDPQPAPVTPTLSPRALVARRALIAALLLGVLADPLLRNEPWGLGLLVWIAALAVGILIAVRRSGRALGGESLAWLAVAVLSAAALSWRDADLLIFFDVLAMLTALTLLAMSLDAIPVPGLGAARARDLLEAAFGTGLEVATGVVPLVGRDAQLGTAAHPATAGNARRIGRALVITVPIVVVFAVLLANADPIFGSFLTLPDIRFDVLFSHVVIAGFFAWVVAGWLRRSLLARREDAKLPSTTFSFALGATDVAFALGALNVLFAAFVAAQIGWLFGGEALVRRTTGLGYAQYARHGFFEVMWVAGLLLPLLLGAQALIPSSEERTRRVYRRLAVPLLLLLGAIMVSAGARMKLYVHYYGISADRLYASAVMIWLAIVFVWFAVTILRARPRAFAAGMVISGFGVLFTLNVLNPDALVARANLARDAAGQTGTAGTDYRYVASLGGDAIPALVAALTAPAAPADSATSADRCTAAKRVLDRWAGKRREEMSRSWTQWSAARSGAIAAVQGHEGELRRMACADAPTHGGSPGSP